MPEHHSQAVECAAAFLLSHLQQVGFARVINHVRDDEIWSQEAVVRQQHLAFKRFHTHTGSVGEDHTAIDFLTQFVVIGQIVQMNFTVSVIADLGDSLLRIGEKFVFLVENRDRFYAIQCRLNAECRCRTTRTQDRHFLADDINTFFSQCAHITGTVGDMTRQYAIVINHGIHRTDQFCRRGKFVQVLANGSFVRHGDVKPAQFKRPKTLYNIFQLLVVYFKCQVDIIQTQMRKGFVMHCRRHAIANRRCYQSNQLSVTRNTFSHDKVLNMLEVEFLWIRGCPEHPYLRGCPARCALRARHQ